MLYNGNERWCALMSDQNIVDASYGATKAVVESEAFNNLASPPAKVGGKLLADFITWVAGGVHYASMKAELKRQKNFEKFKSNITEGINSIPKDDLIEPRDTIIGAATEKAKYSMNEDELREMFENLIINSFDSKKISNIHPSYADIIQQMSPLDAQNLKLFAQNERLPICEIRINISTGGYSTIYTDVFIDNPLCQSIKQQSISISSLRRVGLISTHYDIYLNADKIYDQFKEIPEYNQLTKDLNILNQHNKIQNTLSIKKGIVEITSLGKAFINVCLSPLPKKSNP